MICRLCLKDLAHVIHIFDEIGIELNVADIIKKYFWFEPKIDDPISTAICNSCWVNIVNFHDYFVSIEEAHQLLTERFFVKPVDDSDGSTAEKAEELNGNELSWNMTELSYSSEISDEDEKPVVDLGVFSSNESIASCLSDGGKEDYDFDFEKQHNNNKESTIERAFFRLRSPNKDNEISNTDIRKEPRKRTEACKASLPAHSVSEYRTRATASDLLIAEHMKLTCDLCQIELSDFTKLRKHFVNVHGQKGYVMCCNKKLFKRILLVDHINKHLDPEYFKCTECNKSFADKQCLRNHRMIMHKPDDDKPFQCAHCPKRFIKQYLLEQHQGIHVPMDKRKFPCKLCPKAYPNENTLNTHRKNAHTHEYGKMCHICAKVIRGKSMFEKHQLEHAGVKQPEVQCEKCGSWLKNKHSLQKHLRRHNDEGKTHTCNICGKISPNQSALRSHFRYVHASERNYECGVCKKAFKKPLNLKEHMTTHTGEVLYSCPHCPKTFNSNANMHSHRKKVHPTEWEANRKHNKGKAVGSNNQPEILQKGDNIDNKTGQSEC